MISFYDADHCIEAIRQSLMCNSGTGLVMFHWVNNVSTPYPDFNTWHQCRNADLILEWAVENAVPVTKPIERKQGAIEMEEAPY